MRRGNQLNLNNNLVIKEYPKLALQCAQAIKYTENPMGLAAIFPTLCDV